MTLIAIENVSLRKADKTILQNVSLKLKNDTIMTIIGPNGAGKTSLLKLILGLEKPTTGHIIKKDKISIGYMPQKLKLEPTLPLSVIDFLKIWGRYSHQTMLDTLADVGLQGKEKLSMHTLSGGETQRVLLARALLIEPNLLVLDEPIQGVDIAGQNSLYKLILDIKKRLNCAILLVSHDLHLVLKSSDTVVCLNGHVCCSGSPDDVTQAAEYKTLFDVPHTEELAPYIHHHDHEHDPISGTCSSKEPQND